MRQGVGRILFCARFLCGIAFTSGNHFLVHQPPNLTRCCNVGRLDRPPLGPHLRQPQQRIAFGSQDHPLTSLQRKPENACQGHRWAAGWMTACTRPVPVASPRPSSDHAAPPIRNHRHRNHCSREGSIAPSRDTHPRIAQSTAQRRSDEPIRASHYYLIGHVLLP